MHTTLDQQCVGLGVDSDRKITSGKKLDDSWETMEYDTKVRLTETEASWTTQLSNIMFDKIGSIYMRLSRKIFILRWAERQLPPLPRKPSTIRRTTWAIRNVGKLLCRIPYNRQKRC